MARTTTDPKPHLVTIHMSTADIEHLDRLAKKWGVSRSEVLRRLLRRTGQGEQR
jgi:hypothetical protein